MYYKQCAFVLFSPFNTIFFAHFNAHVLQAFSRKNCVKKVYFMRGDSLLQKTRTTSTAFSMKFPSWLQFGWCILFIFIFCEIFLKLFSKCFFLPYYISEPIGFLPNTPTLLCISVVFCNLSFYHPHTDSENKNHPLVSYQI